MYRSRIFKSNAGASLSSLASLHAIGLHVLQFAARCTNHQSRLVIFSAANPIFSPNYGEGLCCGKRQRDLIVDYRTWFIFQSFYQNTFIVSCCFPELSFCMREMVFPFMRFDGCRAGLIYCSRMDVFDEYTYGDLDYRDYPLIC